jgi:hypothetical protein
MDSEGRGSVGVTQLTLSYRRAAPFAKSPALLYDLIARIRPPSAVHKQKLVLMIHQVGCELLAYERRHRDRVLGFAGLHGLPFTQADWPDPLANLYSLANPISNFVCHWPPKIFKHPC